MGRDGLFYGGSLYEWGAFIGGAALMGGGGLWAQGLPQSKDQSCDMAYNRLMLPSDLALINSANFLFLVNLSWTKADHLAKVSGR